MAWYGAAQKLFDGETKRESPQVLQHLKEMRRYAMRQDKTPRKPRLKTKAAGLLRVFVDACGVEFAARTPQRVNEVRCDML